MLTILNRKTATVAEVADEASEITSVLQDPATDPKSAASVQDSVCSVLDRATLAELREHQAVLTELVKGFDRDHKAEIITDAQAHRAETRDERVRFWAEVYATFLV